MKKIVVQTKRPKEVVDITDLVAKALAERDAASGWSCLFIQHTTAALATADLDPGTDLDMLDAFEAMVPKLRYRHPHDPSHVPDHIMASLIGSSLIVPVKDGELWLGTWQRVVLVELDGPRHREVVVSFISEAADQ